MVIVAIAVAFLSSSWAEGVSGAPPPDDGRAAYLAQPWDPSGARDAAISEYSVMVDGARLPLYTADVDCDEWGSEYYFGSFDIAGRVRIRVKSARSMSGVRILPEKCNIVPFLVNDHEIEFVIDRPMRISVEPEGRVKPLLLFVDSPEIDIPTPGTKDVIWFGPGYHDAGAIPVGSGQTLYLARGAVVSGGVVARGTNITVRGRGILDGRAYARFKGPCDWMLDFRYCRNVKVEGVICRNPYNWVLSMLDCEDVVIDGFKLCGGRMINDDAVDICNCRRFVLRNSFLRSADDVFAIKGNLPFGSVMTACEDVLVEDCEAWTDYANIFRVGFECNASQFARITARKLDVLHASRNFRGADALWANCIFYLQASNDMTMRDMLFEDINIHSDGEPVAMLSARSMVAGCLCRPYSTAGIVDGVTFRNVSVIGGGDFRGPIFVDGHSKDRQVKNLKIENMSYDGRKLSAQSKEVSIGTFTESISFE